LEESGTLNLQVLTIKLNAVQVLGLACFGSLIGVTIKRILPIFDRLNIPGAILGGLVYACTILGLRDRVLNLEMDLVLREVLMVAFFTTVGMAASLRLLVQGGKQVVIFLGAAVLGLVLQVALGSAAAAALQLPPLLGVIPGAVSLTGGPATALAFGPLFEQAGVPGATELGVASAVFGILASGLLGGYVGVALINKHKLRAAPGNSSVNPVAEVESKLYVDSPHEPTRLDDEFEGEQSPMLTNVVALGIAMGLGTLVSMGLQNLGATLPIYIGSMIVAGILRNLDDYFHILKISQSRMDEIGNISLELFIVMALLTLQLWKLIDMALPVLLILMGQIALTVVLCWFVIFRLMGRDHEAAVMSGGYCGFMLGTTANALACMNEIVRKSGPAPRAFFVVSIVGAFLIDFINGLLINASINLLTPGVR
jgi:ESS family glutamate:Na+ symporter